MRDEKLDKAELKRVGLKVTGPRVKILQLLEAAARENTHLSAEDIYKHLSDDGEEVGLATVYRVLTQFETADLVMRHNFESGVSVFELNDGHHHDHIVCVKCGKVKEFIDNVIEERQVTIAKAEEFEMTDHSLVIYGICKGCRDNKALGDV